MQRLSLPVSSRCVQRLQSTPCSRQPALPITPTACSFSLYAAGLRSKRRAQLLHSGPSDTQQPSAVADCREFQTSSATSTGPNGHNGRLSKGHPVAATAPGTAEPGSTEAEPEYILFRAADLAAKDQQPSSNGNHPAAFGVIDGATAVTVNPIATVDAAEQQQQQQGQEHPSLAAEADLASPAAAAAAAAAKDLAVKGQPNDGRDLTDQQQQQQQTAAAAPNSDQDSAASAAATDSSDSEDIFSQPLNLELLETQNLELSSHQPQQQQQQRVPPPLIDPDVDILNDPSFAIRLMDILDQITPPTTAGSLQSIKAPLGTPAAAGTTQQQQQQQQPNKHYNFIRQPAAFCTNCCTPLDPFRPAAPCSSCGHSASNDSLLLNLGVASDADLTRYPSWQQQQQSGSSSSSTGSSGSFVLDTQQLAQRLEAGIALKHAKQLLRDAGILDLNTTVLAYEDDLVDQEPAMMLHRGMLPPNHERPERLKVILARWRTAGLLDVCDRLAPREATDEELLAVHSPGLVAAISALSNANSPSELNQVAAHLSPDTLGNRYTYRAARLAAGTAAEMARQIVTGAVSNGMALIRPMGHNAGIDSTDGGNYFNNAAVAARAAQAAGAKRVMIIDWDIHHGKGTSEIFAEDPNVLVFSLHRYGSGFYPGSGPADDVGIGRGKGRNINVAWCPPTVVDRQGRRVEVDAPPVSDGDYISAFHVLVLPVLTEFKPDLVLVSAGFDAVDKDPLGYYRLHPECFAHLTALLLPLAPVGMLLEGGYNLSAMAASVEACVRVLLGESPPPLPGSRVAGVTGWSSILRTLLVHQQHWQSLGMMNFIELATPVPTEEEWEDGHEDDREDDREDVFEARGEAEEEYELQEGEFIEALEAATAAEQAASPAAAAEEEASDEAETLEAAEDPLQRIIEILDKRIAAQKQAEDLQEQEAEQQQMGVTVGEGEAADAVPTTTSSSNSSGWSAGGFLDDQDTIDSGSDSADDSASWVNPGSRTDWGLEQYDEDVTEHLEWYGGKEAQKQLRRAERAAAAIEGEVVAAVAAERGVEAAERVGTAAAAETVAVVASGGGGSRVGGGAVGSVGGGSGVGGGAVESVGSSRVSSRGGSEQAAMAASSDSADKASS